MSDLVVEREDQTRLDRPTVLGDTAHRGNRPAKALGYLSLGLGVTGLIFARQLGRLMGLRHGRAPRLTRAAGILGAGLRPSKRHRGRVLTAMAAIGGITAIGVRAAVRARALPALAPKPVRRAITIAAPPEQLYAFWRDLENLPSFMTRLVSVEPLDVGRSHWRARGPAGTSLEWDAEIVEDLPSSIIRWQSLAGSVVRHSGSVRFRPAPGLRGTEVSLEVQYEAPGGQLGRWLSSLTREAVGIHFENDLRRLKQILEVGEIVCSDASAHRGLVVEKDGEP